MFTRSEQQVYWVIRSLVKRYGGSCFPKQETIARLCKVSRRTVCYAIKSLKSKGYIVSKQRSMSWHQGGRRLVSNLYRLGKDCCAIVAQQNNPNLKKDKKEHETCQIFTTPKLLEIMAQPHVVSSKLNKLLTTRGVGRNLRSS